MAKYKKATWWKMFSHQRAAIESISDENVGKGLKAAFRYFDGEEIPVESLTPQAFTAFCVIRPYLDEARRDYDRAVEAGRTGGKSRQKKDNPPLGPLTTPKPPLGPLTTPIGCLTEAETEAETERTPYPAETPRNVEKSVENEWKIYCAVENPVESKEAAKDFEALRREKLDAFRKWEPI